MFRLPPINVIAKILRRPPPTRSRLKLFVHLELFYPLYEYRQLGEFEEVTDYGKIIILGCRLRPWDPEAIPSEAATPCAQKGVICALQGRSVLLLKIIAACHSLGGGLIPTVSPTKIVIGSGINFSC